MIISPIFIAMFFVFMGACIIYGCISGYKMRKQLFLNIPLFEEALVYIITRQCGLKGSQNSDIPVTEALKNQMFALSLTLKLIQARG
jgi:uncharacterized protein YneF (UPF0154 family)